MSRIVNILSFYLLSLLMVVFIASCRDKQIIRTVGTVTVTTGESPFYCDFNENQMIALVNCTGRGWRATCNSDWVQLSCQEGNDGDYIYISVSTNMESDRYAAVRFYDIDDTEEWSDYVEIIQTKFAPPISSLFTNTMSKKHRLGYGYDIFGEFNDNASFSDSAVLDYSYMLLQEQLGTQMVTEDYRHVEELEIISANTLTELRSKLTKAETTDKSFLGCGKTTSDSTQIFKQKTINQECGMIRLKQIVSSRTIDLGALYLQNRKVASNGTTDSTYVFSSTFKRALDNIRVNLNSRTKLDQALESFYKKFGTHLVVSADLGGEIRVSTIIERATSVESEHSVKQISKKVFGKKTNASTSVYDKYTENQSLKYEIEMKVTGGSDDIKYELKNKVKNKDIDSPITSEEIIRWQDSFQLKEPEDDGFYFSSSYNASMVDCRLVPLYDLVDDAEVSRVIKEYFISLNGQTIKESDSQESLVYSVESIPEPGVDLTWEDLYSRCIYGQSNERRATLGYEYIPSIRTDRPCLVAYPFVSQRPFMYCGVFLGDETHLPGVVRWLGNNCLYEPSEEFSNDSLGYKSLLDQHGRLKNIYLYWGAVQMIPQTGMNYGTPTKVSTAYMSLSQQFCTTSNPKLVKVGPHYWTPTEMLVCNNSTNALEHQSISGQNYVVVGEDETHWVSQISVLKSHLPNYLQAQSVMTYLNGNTSAMTSQYYENGANILGLKWPKGYYALNKEGKLTICDPNSWLIPTCDGNLPFITRLSLSGSGQSISLNELFQAVGYYDSQFIKYIPFFFCTDEVY